MLKYSAPNLCIEGSIICINGVTVTYRDVVALWQINLDIIKGEYLGIAGPNGSGKTTLLKTILGLIEPIEGQVSIYGQPISYKKRTSNKILKKIAYVPQAHQIDSFFPASVKDVVLMGRYGLNGIGKRLSEEDFDLARRELETIGMWEQKDRPIGHLSGGQQQKVLIARALVRDPEILLLDEPTSNLDFKITKEIFDLITNLHKTRDLTVVSINHNLKSLRQNVDRLVILNRTILYEGNPNAPQVDEIIQYTFFS